MNPINFKIEMARLQDLQSISNLNKKWLRSIESLEINNSKGFLFGDPFSRDDLKRIINSGEIAVAKFEDLVVGYYLMDNYSDTVIFKEHQQLVGIYLQKELQQNKRISKRMQSVVDLEFQMQGLSKSMFNRLLGNVEDRYDILFATVSKLNPKLKAHLSAGWKILRETDELFLLTYSIVH